MSSILSNQEYAYLTITGEGSAQEILEKYNLRTHDAWNAGDVSEDRYLFNQMCLRFKSGRDDTKSIEDHLFSLLAFPQRYIKLPDELVRTIHCVTHSYHSQGGGCFLDSDIIRRMAQIKADVQLYLYKMVVESNHDFPYAKIIKTNSEKVEELDKKSTNEYAYFNVRSNALSTDEISQILQLQPTTKHSIGDPRRNINGVISWEWSLWELGSGLAKGQPIEAHLEALLSQLKPRIEQLYLLSQDFQTSFTLGATGTFPNSHQIKLNQMLIQQMAKLNLSFDFDSYFDYD